MAVPGGAVELRGGRPASGGAGEAVPELPADDDDGYGTSTASGAIASPAQADGADPDQEQQPGRPPPASWAGHSRQDDRPGDQERENRKVSRPWSG